MGISAHVIFIIAYFLRKHSFLAYFFLGLLPSAAIEIYFDRVGRPRFVPLDNNSGGGRSGAVALKHAGEDLDARGLTEFLWDVLYWVWGCMAMVVMMGDEAWWLWLGVPAYGCYAAFDVFVKMKRGLGLGVDVEAEAPPVTSARQRKMEDKGGQTLRYRNG